MNEMIGIDGEKKRARKLYEMDELISFNFKWRANFVQKWSLKVTNHIHRPKESAATEHHIMQSIDKWYMYLILHSHSQSQSSYSNKNLSYTVYNNTPTTTKQKQFPSIRFNFCLGLAYLKHWCACLWHLIYWWKVSGYKIT